MSSYQAFVGGEGKRENETKTADVLLSSQDEEKCCRICLEDDSPNTMIAPCKCKGGSKWVHRECLDLWRTNERDRAFSQCTECLFQYHMMPPQSESPTKWRRAKFYVLVSRDVCLMTLLLQLVVAALGYLVFLCDDGAVVGVFCGSGTCPNGTRQVFGVYYVCGFLLLLVLLGFYGSIVLCINKCSIKSAIPAFIDPEQGGMMSRGSASTTTPHQSVMYRNHRRRSPHRRDADCCDCCVYGYHPIYVYNGDNDCCFCCCTHHHGHYSHNNNDNDCGDCCGQQDGSCSGGHHAGGNSDGSCKNEGSHILLILIVVLAIIMAIIGFVVGIIIAVLLFQRVIQTHIYLLHKRQLVKEFTVMDLSAYDLDVPLVDSGPTPPTVYHPAPSAPPMHQDAPLVDSGLTKSTVYHPAPSAPPMHQDDVIYLQKLGLMS